MLSPTTQPSAFGYPLGPIGMASGYEQSMSSLNRVADSDRIPSGANSGNATPGTSTINGVHPAILIRRLPINTTEDALRSMLLFAKNLVEAKFIKGWLPEDAGFASAYALFETKAAAEEARGLLDGKLNSTNEANMIVCLAQDVPSANAMLHRRNTIDQPPRQSALNSLSQVPPSGLIAQQAMFRYEQGGAATNGTIRSGDFQSPDQASRMQSLFSAQSPPLDGLNGRLRVSGKSVIDQEVDEETGELLKDPVAYARNGHSGSIGMPRRSTNPPIPLSHFAGLNLSTNVASPSLQSFGSGNSGRTITTPSSAISPNFPSLGPSNGYHQGSFPRLNYPAANPADQNPPCNTLYVGNLPPDTSEDELKSIFSKQRGYKRMIFRQKPNGPICFVEFDDISWATKSLKELYGYELTNSIKGGIRLSFSKNPLGVRNSQAANMHSPNPMTPHSALSPISGSGLNGNGRFEFPTANGPPPGLVAPPGLGSIPANGLPSPHSVLSNQSPNNPFGGRAAGLGIGISTHGNGIHMRQSPFGNGLNTPAASPALGAMSGAGYPDYMMGR